MAHNTMKTWIRRWLAGEFMELWNDVLGARKNVKKKTLLETLRKSNARRARLAMGGVGVTGRPSKPCRQGASPR